MPFNSRSTAWASFDGRGRVELKRESGTDVASILANVDHHCLYQRETI